MKGLWHALRALRPKQWTKNVVVFAAFVFALGDPRQHLGFSALWDVLLTALLFCLVSSAIYLINDMRDIQADRLHPIKRHRPIASGELKIPAAVLLALVLLALGLAGAARLSPRLLAVMGGYVGLQVIYSFALKQIALVDLFVIATGFVLRALAGAVALDVEISPWLLLCTLLLALFLALCKRRHEKVVLADLASETRASMDQYDEKLLDQLIAIVSAATILCYSLYTLWPDTIEKFGTPYLGFTIPLVIIGLFRYLDLVYRHEKGDRPEHILLTDLPLLSVLGCYGTTVILILWAARH